MTQLLQNAIHLVKQGRKSEALNVLAQSQTTFGSNHEVMALFGNLLLESGQLEQGLAWLSKAISLAPTNKSYYQLAIQTLLQNNAVSGALQVVDQMSLIPPLKVDALIQKVGILSKIGRYQDAVKPYEELTLLLPQNANVFFNKGNNYKNLGEYTKAIDAFDRSYSLNSDLKQVFENKAICFAQLGKTKDAINAFDQAISETAFTPELFQNYVALLLKLHFYDRALAILDKGLSLYPGQAELELAKLVALSGLKDHERVASFAREVLSRDPDFHDAKSYLGEALCQLNDFDSGMGHLLDVSREGKQQLLNTFPALVFYGKSKEYKEQVAEIIEDVKQIIETDAELDVHMKANLSFPIADFYHHAKNYEESYHWLVHANESMSSTLSYQQQTTDRFAERTRELFEQTMDLPDIDVRSEKQIVFVLGMTRSGTSLVEQILDSHSQVAGFGELNFGNQARKQLEESLLAKQHKSVELSDIIAFRDSYLSGIGHDRTECIYVDKLPANFWNIGLLKKALPEAHFVHCKRDALETCFSIYQQNFTGFHDYSYSVSDLKHYYRTYESMMAFWEAAFPNMIHLVEYENLVESIQENVIALLDHIGLAFEETCLNFHKNKRVVATASRNQVNQPLYKSSLRKTDFYPQFVDAWNLC